MRQIPFFGVVADPQSYLNVLYLLLAFPLGIGYFVFLVTGTSLGVGLAIIWVGIPILLIVLVVSWALCQFERALAVLLLKEDTSHGSRRPLRRSRGWSFGPQHRGAPVRERVAPAQGTPGQQVDMDRHRLPAFEVPGRNRLLCRRRGHLTFAFVGAPLYYGVDDGIYLGVWQIDMLWEAAILSVAGVFLGFISLNVMNVAAFLSGRLARVMLGRLH